MDSTEAVRALIVVGAITPATEAGRVIHEDWHEQHNNQCGSAGCGFLGRILAIESEARSLPQMVDKLPAQE